MKEKINKIVNQIIEWSEDNCEGTVLSRRSIKDIITLCLCGDCKIDRVQIDSLIDKFESESGYLVKAYDFIEALDV